MCVGLVVRFAVLVGSVLLRCPRVVRFVGDVHRVSLCGGVLRLLLLLLMSLVWCVI